MSAVRYPRNNLTSNLNATASAFETTIQEVDGLLAAHEPLTDNYEDTEFDPQFWYPTYDDALLSLAVDFANRRILPFDSILVFLTAQPIFSRVCLSPSPSSQVLEAQRARYWSLSHSQGTPVTHATTQLPLKALSTRHQRRRRLASKGII